MLPSSARHRLKVTVAAADLLPIPLHHRVSIVSVSRDPTMAIALFPSFSDHLVHNGGRGADNRWKVGREGPTVVPRGMKQRRHRSFPGQALHYRAVGGRKDRGREELMVRCTARGGGGSTSLTRSIAPHLCISNDRRVTGADTAADTSRAKRSRRDGQAFQAHSHCLLAKIR
nr:uncharacterized protein LOC109745153 isoform X2 [Aegilops tauschii subsp. strangulata]